MYKNSNGNLLILILLAPSSSPHRSRYICHHSGCRFGGAGEALRGGVPPVFAWRQLLHGGGVLDFPHVVQTDHEPGRDFRYSHTHTHLHIQWSSQEWREQQCTMGLKPLYFPGYLSLYVVYVVIVIVSSFIYQRQKRLMLASSESTSVPGYSHKHTHRQPMKRRNKYRLKRKRRLLLQRFTRRSPRMMTFLACSMGAFNKNMVDPQHFTGIKMVHLGSPWWARVCVCVSESEYRPLLPSTESTSQILLTSLNPVDSRKWRRKPWSWRVFKVLKVCRIPCLRGVCWGLPWTMSLLSDACGGPAAALHPCSRPW